MSQSGASSALAGYRVQALYSLKRILISNNEHLIFQPEGQEDLDILENDQLVELVQVKRYTSLQLSDIVPFLRRAVIPLNGLIPPHVKLVNFGELGPELANAWLGHATEKQRVRDKLTQQAFLSTDIDKLFNHVELITIDEINEEKEVFDLLHDRMTGVDPPNAFDLLHAWLFGCMEKQKAVTLTDTLEKVLNVGRFLAERRDRHDQWFTTILPLEAQPIIPEIQDRLRKEFYAGGFTRYDHIVAELDFRRDEKLAEIKRKFEKSNVVIIHAASGQGKTTLALRYVHDYYSPPCRFTIARVEGIQHALNTANALNGYARAIQVPMVVYLDVYPRDTNWPVLVGQLAQHPYLQLLITMREEDYRRANVTGEGFTFTELSLDFDESEARLIYERARQQTSYLNFESAWDAFHNRGPLLEFAHLLTQNTTLEQRLQGQVQRIQAEVRNNVLDGADLRLLQLIAIATAYEARVDTRKLIHYFNLRLPEQTLNYFQEEYLIRVSHEGYIEGLHALRSSILVKLLTSPDVTPWLSLAKEVLPLLLEEDLETFLLYAFSEQAIALIPVVIKLHPQTWRGRAGILRSLMWVGLRDYIEANQDVIEDARKEFGAGWYFIVDLNFAGDEAPSVGRWWQEEGLAQLFSNNRKAKLNDIRARQLPKDEAFKLVQLWLSQPMGPPLKPSLSTDWAGATEILYWASRLELVHIGKWIEDEALNEFVTSLTLPILANFSFALYCYDKRRQQAWLHSHKSALEDRLAQEYGIVYLEEKDNENLLAHYIVEEGKQDKSAKDPLHAATIERLQLIRELFPTFEQYGGQGYGHKLGSFYKLSHDSTQKPGVYKKYLTPDTVIRPNQIALGIGRFRYRLDTWLEYAQYLFSVRQLIIICLEQLKTGLGDALQNNKPINLLTQYIDTTTWDRCRVLVNDIPELPKVAVDQWGFASEGADRNISVSPQERYVPKAIALKQYRSLLETQLSYSSSIHNFMEQAIHVIATNFNLSRLPRHSDKTDIIVALNKSGFKTDLQHLSTYNLYEAKQSLIGYQQEFERLFGHLIDTSDLVKQEQDSLNAVWPLWYFYAFEPESIKPSALRNVPLKLEQAQSRFRHKLQKALTKASTNEGLTARLLATHPDWKDGSALWINVNIEDPVDLNAEKPLRVNTALEEIVLPAIRNEIGIIDFQELSSYIIREHFKYLVFILTVRGRMFHDIIFPLDTAFTVLSKKEFNQESWISFIGELLPTEIRAKFGLEVWDSVELNAANQFANSVAGLMFVFSQIAEFADLPGISDVGEAVLQTHLKERSKQLNEIFEQVQHNAQVLLDAFDTLSEEETKERPYLLAAHRYLTEFIDFLKPLTEGERHTLGLKEVKEYAELLTEVFLVGEVIRQYWLADFLSH